MASLERQLAVRREMLEMLQADIAELDDMESRLEVCSALPESQESEHASELAADDDVAAVLVGMHGPPAV